MPSSPVRGLAGRCAGSGFTTIRILATAEAGSHARVVVTWNGGADVRFVFALPNRAIVCYHGGMNYELDQGLIVAAERRAAEINSHGILYLLKDYRWWADLANANTKRAAIDATLVCVRMREDRLRKALIANRASMVIASRSTV